jgi:hypothetical protein
MLLVNRAIRVLQHYPLGQRDREITAMHRQCQDSVVREVVLEVALTNVTNESVLDSLANNGFTRLMPGQFGIDTGGVNSVCSSTLIGAALHVRREARVISALMNITGCSITSTQL